MDARWVLVVLWLFCLLTVVTMQGFIHVLLIIGVVVVLLRIIQGRRPLQAAYRQEKARALILLVSSPSEHS